MQLLNQLIAAEINRHHESISATPPLTPQQWGALYSEARRQTVATLALNAIERDRQLAASMPLELAARWLAETENIRRRNAVNLAAERSLTEELHRHGIETITLKGNSIAALYPDPSARQSGDIDLYLPARTRQQISRFLAGHGINTAEHSDGSRSFRWQSVEIELHNTFFDIHSPLARRRLKRMFDADPSLTLRSPEATLLMLSAHILKHAIGRGIGLRQLADLAIASRTLTPQADPIRMRRLIRAAGLRRWTDTVYSFLHRHLALPAESFPAPDITISPGRADRLARIVDRGGNFGLHNGTMPRTPQATVLSFIRSARFSLLTAPAEALSTVSSLIKGRLSLKFKKTRQ